MSKYDPNPFGDSEGAANPFGDPAPSIVNIGTTTQNFTPVAASQAAPRQQPAAAAPNLSNQFGFYEDASRPSAAYGTMSSPSSQPAGAGFTSPAYMDNARSNTSDLRRRQEELEKKAADLERREMDLRNSPNNVKKNNWPPISIGRIGPCFYQDFEVDIAIEYKKVVKGMYYVWIGYSIILLLNLIACIAYMSVSGTTKATTFGLSVLWMVLFTPCSFLLWYRPLYKAFRSDSSMNFFIFFGIFSVQFGVTIVQCIGLDACGTSGVINGLTMITEGGASHIGVGIFMLAVGALFGILATMDAFMLIRILRIYRTTGASFEKAKQEFAVTSMKNPHVQNVAVDVAGRAAQDAFSGRGQF